MEGGSALKSRKRLFETTVHGVFLILGLITVGFVLLITGYLEAAGIPAIRKIGLIPFLFGKEWASTKAEPSFGILPFILTSVYGTAGALLLGTPIGFLTAVYLSKAAKPKVRAALLSAVSLLAGIPSVVYGLVGMLVLVPGIRALFHVPDGASLLAAMVVLAVMILPSIVKVSVRTRRWRWGPRRWRPGFGCRYPRRRAVSRRRWCGAWAERSARRWRSSWCRATRRACRSCSAACAS